MFLISVIFLVYSCSSDNKQEQKKAEQKVEPTAKEQAYTLKLPVTVPKDSVPENGEYTKRYATGGIEIQGMMKNGKREGLWKSFYEDGTPWSKTTFKEGLKDGPTTTWYENGKMRYEGFYKDDDEKGVWKYYDEKGNFIKTFDYDKQ